MDAGRHVDFSRDAGPPLPSSQAHPIRVTRRSPTDHVVSASFPPGASRAVNVLVTGMGGFVAAHLLRELKQAGHRVWGVDRVALCRPELEGGAAIVGDLCRPDDVREAMATARPDAVIHLAAQSSPARSWDIPVETFHANVGATVEIVRAAAELSAHPRVLFVSSSDVYGIPEPHEGPIRESHPLRPATPYAVSKAAAEQTARLFARRHNVELVIARPFSHTGPGQTPGFVVPAFAHQIALIESGRADILEHGDLHSSRDFSDVRDVVKAYRLLIEKAPPGLTFNICSGRSVPVQTLLDTLVGMSTAPIPTRPDPARMRGEKTPPFHGNCDLLREIVGWAPNTPLETTLRDVLEDQRRQVAATPAPPAAR